MSIQNIKQHMPEYAKDIKLNLSGILTEEGAPRLTQKQIYLTALASAYCVKDATLLQALLEDSAQTLSEADINAAKASATIMAMNNIYYRAIHLMSDKEYTSMPANLRMSIIGRPGVEKIDFELMSLAVSAINGCGMCIEAHAQQAIKAGLNKTAVQSTIRIAAVIHAAAQAISMETNIPGNEQLKKIA